MKKGKINTLENGRQVYSRYTEEDRRVWSQLFSRQMQILPDLASGHFLEGVPKVGFTKEAIPEFGRINALLGEMTGWEVVPVAGIVDDKEFFELMAARKFPATTWLRSLSRMEYLEEPDMFHDVFAHVPLLSNPAFASFLEQISKIGLRFAGEPEAIALLSRIYWFTVEFGLIRENGKLRIYGAGILSSSGESAYSVGIEPMHFEYSVEQVLNTPYRKDIFQDRYFIIESFEKLFESVNEITERIEEIMTKRLIFTRRGGSGVQKNEQDLVPSW